MKTRTKFTVCAIVAIMLYTVAKVNVASGMVDLNVGNKNDKELVVLMQSYVDAFM